jgi:hypothetical protein
MFFIHIHYETLLSGRQIFFIYSRVKGFQDPSKISIFSKKPKVEIFRNYKKSFLTNLCILFCQNSMSYFLIYPGLDLRTLDG